MELKMVWKGEVTLCNSINLNSLFEWLKALIPKSNFLNIRYYRWRPDFSPIDFGNKYILRIRMKQCTHYIPFRAFNDVWSTQWLRSFEWNRQPTVVRLLCSGEKLHIRKEMTFCFIKWWKKRQLISFYFIEIW